MDKPGNRTSRTSGVNTWRAGCSESCTSGSEGGPEKPTCRKTGRALRSDPYTFVSTWQGVAYVCFIIDAFSRRIVGWRVASHMRTVMVLDALEMARGSRGTRFEGLVAHSDAGSQYTSIRYTERLEEIGATPSIGTVADSLDNALAESTNSLYKAELIYGPEQGPWKTVADVELATLAWVHWFNTQRLHGYLDDIPPAEYEDIYHAERRVKQPVGNQ
jgi:putative transposase